MYYGERSKAEHWFRVDLGYPKPEDTSVVDYILDLINIDFAKESIVGEKSMLSLEDVKTSSLKFKKGRIVAGK